MLLFIAAVAVAILVARRASLPQPLWAWRVPANGIGAIAAFWAIERIASFGFEQTMAFDRINR